MKLFSLNTLFYYGIHSLGFFLCMASMFGIPGQMENTNPKALKIFEYYNFFLNLAWIGIPMAFLGSIVAFIFEWKVLWTVLPLISLVLGLSAFLCLLMYYKFQ